MVKPSKVELSSEDRDRIRAAREKSGLSQTDAAVQVWPDAPAASAKVRLSQIELGTRTAVDFDDIAKILALYGLELTDLKIRKSKR